MRMIRYVLLIVLLVATGFSSWLFRGGFGTPRDVEAFQAIQDRVQFAANRAIPAVVAVEQPGPFRGETVSKAFSSGVIIAADGLVLSQHHVSHRHDWNGSGPWINRKLGDRTTVVLADGREVQAELLGADEAHDLSLLQIVEPGPYPFIEVDLEDDVTVGEWVIEIGHAMGYNPDRGAVTRLGRVLSCEKGRFATDCNVIGGDSGGPILNLDGRLIGIPGTVIKETLGAEWRWSARKWKRPASMSQPVTIVTATSSSIIQQRLPDLIAGKLLPREKQMSDVRNQFLERGPRLPHSDWTQGTQTSGGLNPILESIRPSIVEILDPNHQHLSTGVLVSSDGTIVGIAQALPKEPACRMANGEILTAALINVDDASGLALLAVSRTELPPLSFDHGQTRVSEGSIVAAPVPSDAGRRSVCIGIVSTQPSWSLDATTDSLQFFESDMPILLEQLGQPVVGLDGKVLGLVIESTAYGCKVLSTDSMATRVKYMDTAKSRFNGANIGVHDDVGSGNHQIQPSDETGQIKMDDLTSRPTD